MDLRRNVAVADLLTVATLSRTKSTILRLLEDHIFLIAESSFGFLILNIVLFMLVCDVDVGVFVFFVSIIGLVMVMLEFDERLQIEERIIWKVTVMRRKTDCGFFLYFLVIFIMFN